MSDERKFPPSVIPDFAGALGLVAAAVLVAGVVFGWVLGSCDRPEPIQMIPSPMPAAISAAIATSSAQVVATQSVRVTIRIPKTSQKHDNGQQGATQERLNDAMVTPSDGAQVSTQTAPNSEQTEEITVEVSQAIASSATSSAQASAKTSEIGLASGSRDDHGLMGVIVAYPIGLAADVELARLDVPPWLVGVPLEVGLDVAGNLEAGAVGVTVGGKAFAGAYGWSRWNLGVQGLALGAGMRF